MPNLLVRIAILMLATLLFACGGDITSEDSLMPDNDDSASTPPMTDIPPIPEQKEPEVPEVPEVLEVQEVPEIPEIPEIPEPTKFDIDRANALLKTANCAGCHGNNPGFSRIDLTDDSIAEFADKLVDRVSYNEKCVDELLIDSANPENSLFLKLIDPNFTGSLCSARMPLGSTSGVSDDEFKEFQKFVTTLIEFSGKGMDDGMNGSEHGENPEDNSNDNPIAEELFEKSALSVLTKAKYLSLGESVLPAELELASNNDGSINKEQFKLLLDDWIFSDEHKDKFRLKRNAFLGAVLQQEAADRNYRNQFFNTNAIPGSNVVNSLVKMAHRTVSRIADKGEDFRTIMTTNTFEVNSMALIALKFADHKPARRKGIRGVTPRLSDAETRVNKWTPKWAPVDTPSNIGNDWRTVTLLHDPTTAPWTEDDFFVGTSKLNQIIDIPNNGVMRLRAERFGLCSTPTFFQQWITNADNNFRVTVNQCLILGLGEGINLTDITETHHDLTDIDLESFPMNSDCLACHEKMDPMATLFLKNFDPKYNRYTTNPTSVGKPNFSFNGITQPVKTLKEFTEAIAYHPEFSIGWAQKVCNWVFSKQCERDGPILLTVAEKFEQSGYQLDALFHALLSSDLMIETSGELNTRVVGAKVSISRRDHFCTALQSRGNQAIKFRGSNSSADDYCSKSRKQSSIPNDVLGRGNTALSQATSLDPMIFSSYTAVCENTVRNVVGGRTGNPIPHNNETLAIELLSSVMLGFPEGTASYDRAVSELTLVYDFYTNSSVCSDSDAVHSENSDCGLGYTRHEAINALWSQIVCPSPSLIGVGL